MKSPHFYHWYCQHVIPLVFDDSLSYYEVLCKLTKAMGDLTKHQDEYLEQLKAALDVINTAWPEFEQTVNDKLSQYETNYNSFTEHWNETLQNNQTEISNMQASIAAMDTELRERLQAQDEKITESLASNLDVINAAITAQDAKIQNFIDTYNPTPIKPALYPVLHITTTPDAIVRAVHGETSVTGTANSTGALNLTLDNYGDWVVTATGPAGTGDPVSVNVDTVKIYDVEVSTKAAPTSYSITIHPIFSSFLETVFTRGKYKITSPNGSANTYSAVKDLVVNVTEPGTYKFEYQPANVLPNTAASAGFVITGPTELWSTAITHNIAVNPDNESYNIRFTVPTITIGLNPSNLNLNITPPDNTNHATGVTSQGPLYYFIPWIAGQWLFNDNQGFDKGYTITAAILPQVTFGFDLKPTQIQTSRGDPVYLPYSNTLTKTTPTTLADIDHVQSTAESVFEKLKIKTGGVAGNSQFVGYLDPSTYNNGECKYTDGTDFLDTHYPGVVVPKLYQWQVQGGQTEQAGEIIELGLQCDPTVTGTNAYSITKDAQENLHDAILICSTPTTDNTPLAPGYAGWNARVPASDTVPTNASYPPLPDKCEYMRLDHVLFISLLNMGICGLSKVVNWRAAKNYATLFTTETINNTPYFNLFPFKDGIRNLAPIQRTSNQYEVPDGYVYPRYSTTRRVITSHLTTLPSSITRQLFPTSEGTTKYVGPVSWTGSTNNTAFINTIISYPTTTPYVVTFTSLSGGGRNYPVFFLDNE